MTRDSDLVWSATTWRILIQELAERLEQSDPAFDRQRFLTMAREVFIGERLQAVIGPDPRD